MADKYADTKYLNDPSASVAAPTGPIAVPQMVRGEDGLMRTVYIDPKTGNPVNNLNGYTVVTADGGVYKVTESDDENKDGTVDQTETQKGAYSALGLTDRGHTTREDALGHTPGPKATESNNFGYHSKPGLLGAAAMVTGLVNPGIGAGLGMLGRAYNVGNMEAVNDARKMLGLSPLTGKQMASGAMKDNKGQIARVEMGNNKKYSVGFEAMSPTGKTNLTLSEAAKRAAMFGMKEVPDDTKKESTFGSKIAKALGIEPGIGTKALKAVGLEPGIASKGLKAVGLQKGFATRALNHVFGVTPDLPDTVDQTPTARPEDLGQTTPGAANNTPSQKTSKSHLSAESTPEGVAAAAKNIDKSAGLGNLTNGTNADNPANAAKAAQPAGFSFAGGTYRPDLPDKGVIGAVTNAVSKALGPGYSVVGVSGRQTPAQMARIENGKLAAQKAAAGATLSKVERADMAYAHMTENKNSRHTIGKALDFDVVDPTGKKVTDDAKMSKVAAQFSYDNPTAGVGYGKGYMAPGRMHLDTANQPATWGAGGKSKNVSQALKDITDQARKAGTETAAAVAQGYQATPGFFTDAVPSPAPAQAVTGFVSQDERATDTGNVKNAVDHVRSQLGLGQVPDNVGAPSTNPQTAPEVDRNYAGQGVTPSKSFVSQDEKTNTGNIANAAPANNFVSQDERSSLATRTGITPAALDPVGNSLSPTANNSKVTGSVSAQTSIGAKTVANAVQSTTNAKLGTTPAAMAAMGLTNRTTQEKAAMAKAIAGELSQASLAGVKAKDPKALAEMGSMIASMENRAASKKYDSMSKVLGPTQYNSLMASNMSTTNQNYAANKKALDAAMKQYYSGKIPGVNYDATNYYNPDVADPAWGAKMANQTTLGAHKFGSLPEYDGNQAAKDAAKAMGIMAGTDFSPGKSTDDNIGYSGTGSQFGGPAGQSSGAGFSPGGMNSPSGSSSSSGWQGGGNNGNGTNWGGNGGGNFGGSSPSSGGNNSGLGGPTSNNSGNTGSVSSAGKSPSSSGNMGGLGGPTSNNSGNSSKGGMNSSGSSAGAQSRSDGWN